MSLGVHHLAVVVADLARAEAFYVGVLGLEVIRRWDDDQGAPRSVWLALGGDAFLAVEKGTSRTQAEAAGWHCVALRIHVDERDEWRARLTAAGHGIEKESAYTLYARDPEGNQVAFSHFPHPCPSPNREA